MLYFYFVENSIYKQWKEKELKFNKQIFDIYV